MVTDRKVIVESSAEDATAFAAELVKTVICSAVSSRGTCHLALAGGTTPHGLYQKLAEEGVSGDLPWRKVEVFFGDERDVPQDHADSNYRMAQQVLLDHVPVAPKRIHPMPADSDDLPSAARDYESTIRQIVPDNGHGLPRFDLVLLGMGGDGHVASLFPASEALNVTDSLVWAHMVPVLRRWRMTFTYPLINAAANVVLLVTGADKADAVARLLGETGTSRDELPASAIAPDGMLAVVLDSPAARETRMRNQA